MNVRYFAMAKTDVLVVCDGKDVDWSTRQCRGASVDYGCGRQRGF
jgi:hypothetical protein